LYILKPLTLSFLCANVLLGSILKNNPVSSAL
jgi:hypothetical protein